jgi:hypothetical protein
MNDITQIFDGVPVTARLGNVLFTISKAELKQRYPHMTWDSDGLDGIPYALMLHVSMSVLEVVLHALDNTSTENNIMHYLRTKHSRGLTEHQYTAICVYVRRELFE